MEPDKSISIPTIEARTVHDELVAGENITILDVRTKEEYDEGHIHGSVHLPVDDLEEMAETVLTDKNATVYTQCKSGVRSARAAETLLQKGYRNAKNMKGGILAWEGAGYPIETRK